LEIVILIVGGFFYFRYFVKVLYGLSPLLFPSVKFRVGIVQEGFLELNPIKISSLEGFLELKTGWEKSVTVS